TPLLRAPHQPKLYSRKRVSLSKTRFVHIGGGAHQGSEKQQHLEAFDRACVGSILRERNVSSHVRSFGLGLAHIESPRRRQQLRSAVFHLGRLRALCFPTRARRQTTRWPRVHKASFAHVSRPHTN